MREFFQKYPRIDRAVRSFEYTANGNHPDHALMTDEAMFDKSPLTIPANEARVDLKGLKCFEIAAKLGDRIANHREGFLAARNGKRAGQREPVDAADVGECKISPVIDVEVYIQVIWPYAQRDPRRSEQIDSGCSDQAEARSDQAQPRKHGICLVKVGYWGDISVCSIGPDGGHNVCRITAYFCLP